MDSPQMFRSLVDMLSTPRRLPLRTANTAADALNLPHLFEVRGNVAPFPEDNEAAVNALERLSHAARALPLAAENVNVLRLNDTDIAAARKAAGAFTAWAGHPGNFPGFAEDPADKAMFEQLVAHEPRELILNSVLDPDYPVNRAFQEAMGVLGPSEDRVRASMTHELGHSALDRTLTNAMLGDSGAQDALKELTDNAPWSNQIGQLSSYAAGVMDKRQDTLRRILGARQTIGLPAQSAADQIALQAHTLHEPVAEGLSLLKEAEHGGYTEARLGELMGGHNAPGTLSSWLSALKNLHGSGELGLVEGEGANAAESVAKAGFNPAGLAGQLLLDQAINRLPKQYQLPANIATGAGIGFATGGPVGAVIGGLTPVVAPYVSDAVPSIGKFLSGAGDTVSGWASGLANAI